MSCRDNVRYCVMSRDAKYIVAKTSCGTIDWFENKNNRVPMLWKSVGRARLCADTMNGHVRFWKLSETKKSESYYDSGS